MGSAEPIIRGKLENIFLKSGGVNYGVTNIINYDNNQIIFLNW